MSALIVVIIVVNVLSVLGQDCCCGCGQESTRNCQSAQRGQPGLPGKAGPKGSKGDVTDIENFKAETRTKLQEITNQLTPASCMTSSIYGRQTLRGGKEMFCDEGWTVFQRRLDGSVEFRQSWVNYKVGFGDLSGEFWLGLDKIHNITNKRGCKLRIDLWDFEDDHRHAIYSDFSIENESDLYRLHFGGYSGTAGDSLGEYDLNGIPFSTFDRDNDQHSSYNCASHRGGWWMKKCTLASLNGPWGVSTGSWTQIVWNTWKGKNEALKVVVMKLRCD